MLHGGWAARVVCCPPFQPPLKFHQLTFVSAYNKWNENELERWLSDHNVAYPTPADRKDLEKLVKENWNSKVVTPYAEWEPAQLQSYLSQKGHELDAKQAKEKNWLVDNVKKAWDETESTAEEAYGSVKGWIFDS